MDYYILTFLWIHALTLTVHSLTHVNQDFYEFPKFRVELAPSHPDVDYLEQPVDLHQSINNEIILYRCLIPKVTPVENPVHTPEANETQMLFLSRAILASMPEFCISKEVNSWQYTLCSKRNIIQQYVGRNLQFFIQTGLNTQYMIGRSRSQNENRLGMTVDGSYYINEWWNDGQFCREIERDRQTEIQYMCVNPAMPLHVSEVLEVSVCLYILKVHIPALCPIFKTKKLDYPVHTIHCNPSD